VNFGCTRSRLTAAAGASAFADSQPCITKSQPKLGQGITGARASEYRASALLCGSYTRVPPISQI
jgi:hypothetical protein